MSPPVKILLLAVAGAGGTLLRYAISLAVAQWGRSANFPIATLAVNVLGCVAIGIVAALADSRQMLSPDMRLILTTGLLGGFTTFSAFGLETMTLLGAGHTTRAALYVGASLLAALAGTWLGWTLAGGGPTV